MITFFRNALSSWVVLAILGLVIVAFIITGVGDPFSSGPSATTIAEVGDNDVTDARLSNQFDRRLQTARQDDPSLSTEAAISQGAMEQVLEQLIGADALAAMADTLGLAASKRQIDGEIASMPAFRGPDGRFSETTYRELLASQNLNEATFRSEIGGDIVRRQMLGLVQDLSATPRTLVEPFAALQLESRKLQLGFVPARAFADVKAPDDAEIEAYYKTNIARYTIPERRVISYALLETAAIAAGLTITDKAIEDDYKDRSDVYDAQEERALSQVVVQTKADAEKIAARVAAGETFADVAADVAGYAASDLSLGSQTREALAATVSKSVADSAFATDKGALTAPIQTEFGWHLVRVDDITTKAARPLADVRQEIEDRLRKTMAENKAADLIGEADDAFADGNNIAEVAKDLGLEVVTLPAVTAQGQTLESTDLELDERVRPLIERAFAYDADEDPVVEEAAPGLHALLKVKEIVPATPVPLADIKPQIQAAMIFERQMAAAKSAAEQIITDAKTGKSLTELMRARRLPPMQQIEARRIELLARKEPVPPPITLGFALPEGEYRAFPDARSGAYVIVYVEKITPANLEEAQSFVSTLRSQLRQGATGEWAQDFVSAIMADVGVKRYPDALERLKKRYLGTLDQP